MKKFINPNVYFAGYVVDSLLQFGVRDVVLSPGSRSTPLVLAFDKAKKIRKHVVIDERSNGYFALGLAKASGKPVAIVTTSGTAVAELYPSIIEAFYQRIPLIVCSSDRPLHLVNTGANQTIDQINLFGKYSKQFLDSGTIKISKTFFNSFNKRLLQICTSINSDPGPVHINLRFAKPLEESAASQKLNIELEKFVKSLSKPYTKLFGETGSSGTLGKELPVELIKSSNKILIMVGPGSLSGKDFTALNSISKRLKALIIADGLSGMRFYKDSSDLLLENATAFMRNRNFISAFDPDLIIQFENAPTNNILLNFFKDSNAVKILVNKYGEIKDPSGTCSYIVKSGISEFLKLLKEYKVNPRPDKKWHEDLLILNRSAQQHKEKLIEKASISTEPAFINTLLSSLPAESNLMVSNSIVPRDIDFFANKFDNKVKIFSNRGTSGIDGIISTAAGITAYSKNRTYLLTGDLAFMHDINGLWLLKKYNLPLTIILINNSGGAIFEMLPVYKEDIDFNKYFKVDPDSDFRKIVQSFSGYYTRINSKNHLHKCIRETYDTFAVFEIRTSSKKSLDKRKEYWNAVIKDTQKIIDEVKN